METGAKRARLLLSIRRFAPDSAMSVDIRRVAKTYEPPLHRIWVGAQFSELIAERIASRPTVQVRHIQIPQRE